MLLLSEGDVDLEDFNDVIETSLSLLSIVILVSLASLMTSISESSSHDLSHDLSESVGEDSRL